MPQAAGAVSQSEKINRELKQVRQQMQAAAQGRKQADAQSKTVLTQKFYTAESLKAVMTEIDTVGSRMSAVQSQVSTTTQALEQTARELDEAEQRIARQDERLQSRMRVTYMNGRVSYLDVLLNATSFSDFLGRLDSLHTIMSQDKETLQDRKQDKQLVAAKKAEVEQKLAEVKMLYAKVAEYQGVLADKEAQKTQLISSYNTKLGELGDISEEQEKLLLELAAKESALIKKKNALKTTYSGGMLAAPIKASYRLSSNYGYRIHPISGQRKLHAGADMAAPAGTNIYAAEGGVVLVAQWWSGYGNCIVIDHGGGLWTIYGHIRDGGILVEKGQTVKRGDHIGEVGSTGNSTGNHLHFEVRKNGEPVNPLPYFKGKAN
ncbi:peptidoglycan DD-metalloendopeptidase family protein [Paenibacillus albicereus]|uniref:Peptidoglycan DD-metalloendopeptidase family protein n=2 Tax=Paenibacillus albicereus TaxID=2726185 RepID=A0A6H2H4K1_9BACL|nr:peptidoglycan DD-metalloendopeptidase family protein [Paenibacillus albicereus]